MKNGIIVLLVFIIFGCKKAKHGVQPKPIEHIKSKEVLLVGTFHYHNPSEDVAKTKSFDILKKESQLELEEISDRIKNHKPTKIFVEWPYNRQDKLDSLYQLYKEGSYFQNDSLSMFYLKNEIFQLAFRVAKKNNLEHVYGIDYNETNFPYGDVMNDLEKNKQFNLKAEIEDIIAKITTEFDAKIDSGASLKEITYFYNSTEIRYFSNYLHNNLMLLAGGSDDFNGPLLTSEWFKRNLYMWSLIQKKTTESDQRIMVLVGSSHAAMFELFIKENESWKITELKEVME